jgi:hypothetical protein
MGADVGTVAGGGGGGGGDGSGSGDWGGGIIATPGAASSKSRSSRINKLRRIARASAHCS